MISYWTFCCSFATLLQPPLTHWHTKYRRLGKSWASVDCWESPDILMFLDNESAERTEGLLRSVNTWSESRNLLLPHFIPCWTINVCELWVRPLVCWPISHEIPKNMFSVSTAQLWLVALRVSQTVNSCGAVPDLKHQCASDLLPFGQRCVYYSWGSLRSWSSSMSV